MEPQQRVIQLQLRVMVWFERKVNEVVKNGPPYVPACSDTPAGIIF